MSAAFFGITTRVYHYERTLGRREFSGMGFMGPMDLALGADDLIYVLSRGWETFPFSTRVTMLNFNEDYLGEFSRLGEGDGELVGAASIALDRNQNVYTSDDLLNRISIFDKDGIFLGKWGTLGSGDGELNKPSGIRFDSEDNMYLVDSGNNRVQKFTKDGKFLAKWGEEGRGDGQFNLPWGLAIDDRGAVYVADWGNDRVQKFSTDGEHLATFGRSGREVSEFNRPSGVAVDKEGDIYVADWYNDRVQVLTPDGRHITTFTGEAELSGWGKQKLFANPDMVRQFRLAKDLGPWKHFRRPTAVAIDDQSRIIIAEAIRNRLQVYQKDSAE